MTAERLREAAARLRETATHAVSGTGSSDWFLAGVTECVVLSSGGQVARAGAREARYIATMHPGVALALADWLDQAYAEWHMREYSLGQASIRAMSGEKNRINGFALAVADAVLGES